MTAMKKPPTRFLTHDEQLTMPCKSAGKDLIYRIRVWQGKEETAIVLGSQLTDSAFSLTSKVANYANEAILGFPWCGMLYFEDILCGGERTFSMVYFEHYGHRRLRFQQPTKQERPWEMFEHVLNHKVERVSE